MSIATNSLVQVVDELGRLRAKIADLKVREEELKTALDESGEEDVDGTLFRATVSRSDVDHVDWKTIAARFKPSKRLVKANTETKERVTVKVTSRN